MAHASLPSAVYALGCVPNDTFGVCPQLARISYPSWRGRFKLSLCMLRKYKEIIIAGIFKTLSCFGAEDEARTRDNQLGRLELYQLSYFRITKALTFVGANIL